MKLRPEFAPVQTLGSDDVHTCRCVAGAGKPLLTLPQEAYGEVSVVKELARKSKNLSSDPRTQRCSLDKVEMGSPE